MSQKKERRSDRPLKSSTSSPIYHHQRYPIPLPDVVNMDDLQVLGDDDLASRSYALHEGIRKVLSESTRLDVTPWEIELAYVKREQQIRRARHEMHEAWLKWHDDLAVVNSTFTATAPSAERN